MDRISRRRTGWLKERLVTLLLMAFVLQVTLPYQMADCPMEQTSQAVSKITHIADAHCPLMAVHHASAPTSAPAKGDHGKSGMGSCPFCALHSNLASYVAAGLIALPPPETASCVRFAHANTSVTPFHSASGFSARAPPSRA